jgi:hypothetical protein
MAVSTVTFVTAPPGGPIRSRSSILSTLSDRPSMRANTDPTAS